jgi:three-Cys-motif partner protein
MFAFRARPHTGSKKLARKRSMSKSLGTVWNLEPHTAKKHEILRRYFEAWLPIMASRNDRVVYIDGFAGPGKYSMGEDGSPIVVLKAARDHTYPIKAELVCIFVENDLERCRHLKNVLDEMSPTLPSRIRCAAVHGSFDEHLTKTLNVIETQKKNLAPAFVFIDPFGFSHTPFKIVAKVLGNSRCEVLVNFMYEEVNRFISLEEHAQDFDSLFGTTEWRSVRELSGPPQRRKAIHDIYLRKLKTCAAHVHSFEMLNKGNSTDYFLFFATNNLKGLEKMKEAMWKVDDTGSFQFSDRANALGMMSLFSAHPNLAPLREAILKKFNGRQVSIESLRDWLIAETEFLPKHLKIPILAPMEDAGEVTVANPAPKRRKGTFSDGTILKFS